MPTISSMVQKNDMIANLSYRYFKLDNEAASQSVLVSTPIQTNSDFLKSNFGGEPALTTLVENYSADKNDFRSNIQDRLESLQESSEKLRESVKEDDKESPSTNLSTLSEFSKDNVPPRAKILTFQPNQAKENNHEKSEQMIEQAKKIREDKAAELKKAQRDSFKDFAENYLVAEKEENSEEQKETQSKENSKIVSIQDFVRDYNSTLSYLNQNRGVSNRVSALASNFNRNDDLNKSLSNIGISVKESGELSVDEKELTNALQNKSEDVNAALGNQGLAGRLDKTVNLANYQGENLFPTIEEYTREDKFESWEQLYSAQTMTTANYARNKAGNILNMFT